MKYGEKYVSTWKSSLTGELIESTETYKYASWHEYHTNKDGDGLWKGDKQILGTCQFTVCGCKKEKSAKAKIRNFVKTY